MNVSLTPELERFVNDRVKSGLYGSASEVVRDALRMLADEAEHRSAKLKRLRVELKKGIDSLAAGKGVSSDVVFDELRRRGEKRRK